MRLLVLFLAEAVGTCTARTQRSTGVVWPSGRRTKVRDSMASLKPLATSAQKYMSSGHTKSAKISKPCRFCDGVSINSPAAALAHRTHNEVGSTSHTESRTAAYNSLTQGSN